jgi:hypothetical protein
MGEVFAEEGSDTSAACELGWTIGVGLGVGGEGREGDAEV